MEKISAFTEVENLKSNKVLVNSDKSCCDSNTTITFQGENNILVVEDGVRLHSSKINFNANNSIIYLSSNKHIYYLNVSVFNDSAVYFGKDSYFNGALNISVSEYQNVIIGADCLFSFGIWIRTADPHVLYDAQTKERINKSKGVFLGDHVWIGQNVYLLKGTCVGSGAVVGAASVVSGKKLASNCCYGGNPAKLLKENVFFSHNCVNGWLPNDTKKSQIMDSDDFIYGKSGEIFDFAVVDAKLKKIKTAAEKKEYLEKVSASIKSKNRFYIEKPPVKKKSFFSRLFG